MLRLQSRLLPDSSMLTFFGKPVFCSNYGIGNNNPTTGKTFYGEHLLSHNINPESGSNNPQNAQVFPGALMKAKKNFQRKNG